MEQLGGQYLGPDSLPCSHLLSHRKMHIKQKGTPINPGAPGVIPSSSPYPPLCVWPRGAFCSSQLSPLPWEALLTIASHTLAPSGTPESSRLHCRERGPCPHSTLHLELLLGGAPQVPSCWAQPDCRSENELHRDCGKMNGGGGIKMISSSSVKETNRRHGLYGAPSLRSLMHLPAHWVLS